MGLTADCDFVFFGQDEAIVKVWPFDHSQFLQVFVRHFDLELVGT